MSEFSLGAWLARIWKDNPKEKKHVLYIGVDPGGSGAIGFVYGDHYAVVDMPTVKVKVKKTGKRKNRTDFDLDRIVDLFGGVQGFHGSVKAVVEIAVPQMNYGKSPYAAYRVGMGYYMWPLFLKAKGYKVYEVHAKHWKSVMGLDNNKKRSLNRARKLFPEAELHLMKHEGRAEALVLTKYLKNLCLEGEKDVVLPERRTGERRVRKGRK